MGIKVYKSGFQVVVDDPSKDNKIYTTAYFTRFGFDGDNVWVKDLDFGDLIYLGSVYNVRDSDGNIVGDKDDVETYFLSFIGQDSDDSSTTAPSFDSDYNSYLEVIIGQSTPIPTASQRVIANQLVLDIKSSGAWAKADVISLFATDAGEESSKVNLYPPSLFPPQQTGSLTFTSDVGFASDGVDGHLNSLNLLSDTTNFTLNNAGIYSYAPQGTAVTTHVAGSLDTVNGNRGFHFGDSITNRTNTVSTSSGFALTENFVGIRRTSSSSIDVINGIAHVNTAINSAAIPDTPCGLIGRYGSDGSLSTSPISFVFIGADLTNTEEADLKTAIETYMGAI